jgi:hypothetical protein
LFVSPSRRKNLEVEDRFYSMKRGPVDALRVDGPVAGDAGLAEGRVEVVVPRLAVVGGPDIERLPRRRDRDQVDTRITHGFIDSTESEPRARTDEPSLLEHLGRGTGGQRLVVHRAAREAERSGHILAAQLGDTGRALKNLPPVTLE